MRTSFPPTGWLPGSEEGKGYRRLQDTQATAWIVLWIAFSVFWALVIGAFVGAKYYYDTASIPHTATLSLEQGIVLFRDAVTSTLINASDKMSLREGDDLLVGEGARASVSLFDSSSVKLYSGSELWLNKLRESRFHEGFSRVSLRLEKGTARLQVAKPSNDAQFVVATPHGSVSFVSGDFGLQVSEAGTRLSSREGSASASAGGKIAELKAGEKVLLSKDTMSDPLPEGDSLVSNGDFSQGFAQWERLQVDEAGRPAEPGKWILFTDNVAGKETVALRVLRVSPLATHNETGLRQAVNRDVSDYQSLQLRADVRVDEQSLSGGGYLGYEYPMMIRVRYRDSTGGQIDWSHGFFHKNPEGRPTPNGEEILPGQWFSYIGDLMQVKPKPVYIVSVEVLGAGHTFDGAIANVSLVGK